MREGGSSINSVFRVWKSGLQSEYYFFFSVTDFDIYGVITSLKSISCQIK